MEPYVQRMIEEYYQLSERIDKLEAFVETAPIFKSLPIDEQSLLKAQLGLMQAYCKVLTCRIDLETSKLRRKK